MAIKVGIAPDSWGVWFPANDPNSEKQPPWWRCLDEMKVAGYEAVKSAHGAICPTTTRRCSKRDGRTRTGAGRCNRRRQLSG